MSSRTADGLAAVDTLPGLECRACGTHYPVRSLVWRCECGGLLDVAPFETGIDVAALSSRAPTMWRYREAFPIDADPAVSLGEGMSPLIRSAALPAVRLKLDFLMPTLSFKDRGAVMLATLARRLGVENAMIDSSGNAGTAVAAYFARAGVGCTVFVPESTSSGKLAQLRAHGATVVLVPGTRADTSAAALDAAGRPGVMYASHVYHPYFFHGVKSYGYELWEQNGFQLPETVVLPVGNGTLVLGCYLAFSELLRAGLVSRMPTIVAVQASACAPLEAAELAGADEPAAIVAGDTIAEGIAISAPPRGAQILAAVRATGGTIVSVDDDHVRRARQALADEGLFVEPTAAACFAAAQAAHDGEQSDTRTWALARPHLTGADVVVPLCGAGLKSPYASTPAQ
ncbi:threonine synthase [Gryllotalpicola reticulitermitis]|uniref:Threonine synthase n=1 Tax=Gryllotalpicola reticulitermitis TaxID=1184153 RepID=A0ABV8Q1F8_9MICO